MTSAHTMRMLDAYMGVVMKWTISSVELAWYESFLVYMVVHVVVLFNRPRTRQFVGDERGSAVRNEMALT